MNVYETARTVLAIRKYQDKPVPGEIIRRIIEAGRLTGSSINGQPWYFIVIENRDTLRKLGILARTGRYIPQAPVAVVVVIEKTQYAVSDASRAIQSMILTAWSEGVGSNWVGFFGLDEVKPILGIPAKMEVLAIVPFGYSAQPAGKGKKQRKSPSEVVFHEEFGQPFS
jgi:nitroreductase